jgi:hypothetical protein
MSLLPSLYSRYFSCCFGIQFLAVFIHLHLIRQRKGHIEFDFFARFFQGDRKITGLTGHTGHHGIGLYADVGVIVEFLDLVADGRARVAS